MARLLRKTKPGFQWTQSICFAKGLTLLLLAMAGCGPATDRLEISGKITLDGKPLDSGSIRFTSAAGEKLLVSGAMIVNGEYDIPREKGLLPGVYHLEIYSPDHEAPPIMARQRPGGPGIQVAPERIPAEYNVKSEQKIEVTTDGDNYFVFDILSAPKK